MTCYPVLLHFRSGAAATVWFAVLLAAGGAEAAAQEPLGPLEWRLANSTAHAFAPRVFELRLELDGRCLVRLDGEDVPAVYDAQAEVLTVFCSVPPGGGTLEAFPGRSSSARPPKWRKPKLKRERRTVDLGTIVRRMEAVLDNGVLRATIPADERVHGRLELEALEADWRLVCYPLGSSVGCVETEAIGSQLRAEYTHNRALDELLFSVFPSVVTNVEVLEPNPFQRVLRAEAFTWAVQGNGKAMPVIEAAGYDLTMTWGSPVVRLRAWRRAGSEYFNHNGVNLNEIQLEGEVTAVRHGAGSEGFELPVPERYSPVPSDRSAWIEHGGGTFLLDQPDFASLGIYRPGLFVHSGRLMSVLSQSWGEGWKPILIPAEDREDRATLVCAFGDSPKTFEDWMVEIGSPLAVEVEPGD